MSLTFTDIFCGAGGTSTGMVEAGFELVLAANHWQRAIETHALNHPRAEHMCADVNNYDMRRLPGTDVLCASPICTENSPAGAGSGRRSKRADGQLPIEELGHVPQAGFERTRATFHDVIRATEVHRYKAVIVENVPDVVWRWELFDWWCQGMIRLGYRMRILSADAAHLAGVGNDPAAQWRKRIWINFIRNDIPMPDLELTPPAWCPLCETDVHAVQTWKPSAPRVLGQPVGKYRQQYTYTCPRGHATVEPYVLPAASIIDWSDLGARIGDRRRPLAKATQAKILDGLRLLREPALITVNHQDADRRPLPLASAPLPTRTVKIGEGIATHPLLVPCGGSRYDTAYSTTGPMRPRLTRESEAIVTPPAFIATLRRHGGAQPVAHPVGTITGGGNHHALIIPYHRGNHPTTTNQPLHTLATRDSGALVHPEIELEDCRLRMLKPREQLSGQRFPTNYRVVGNLAEQTMQAGNANPVNAAHWIGQRIATALA
ncbi:MAG TPA: DNA cytosine methyltransferase [Actinocrinis sp.]|uniref:DNA cytosine methyltransferase n=1 Tax=Actinocrinis sp. TaxID=1920516 RepID=UPI002DDDB88D|nr:DNA cytosine methyltransferase [Actinocrinis sp.]HEV2343450.1 DNA cytosine methyltransferase [Actinocrinis sp.]